MGKLSGVRQNAAGEVPVAAVVVVGAVTAAATGPDADGVPSTGNSLQVAGHERTSGHVSTLQVDDTTKRLTVEAAGVDADGSPITASPVLAGFKDIAGNALVPVVAAGGQLTTQPNGRDSVGAPITVNPVVVGAADLASGNVSSLLTAAQGLLTQPQGTDAIGAPSTANPVLVAGVTVAGNVIVPAHSAAGSAIVAGGAPAGSPPAGDPFQVAAVSIITGNVDALLTDGAGSLNVNGPVIASGTDAIGGAPTVPSIGVAGLDQAGNVQALPIRATDAAATDPAPALVCTPKRAVELYDSGVVAAGAALDSGVLNTSRYRQIVCYIVNSSGVTARNSYTYFVRDDASQVQDGANGFALNSSMVISLTRAAQAYAQLTNVNSLSPMKSRRFYVTAAGADAARMTVYGLPA
jgi:hypothetical protein